MDLQLGGAVVLITGASRGLGSAMAIAFAGEGARVAICARDQSRLEATANEVRNLGAECLAIAADLTELADCDRFVNTAADTFGRVDVLINNVSMNADSSGRAFEHVTDAEVCARFHGKTMPAIRCSRAAVPHLRRAGGGRIVMIAGTSAQAVGRGDDLLVPNSASAMPQGLGNAAIANFAKYLAEEVAPDQILVNVVHPFAFRTERHAGRRTLRARKLGVSEEEADASFARTMPIGRIIETADVVPLVLFLASPLVGAITGQAIAVDGGKLRQVKY